MTTIFVLFTNRMSKQFVSPVLRLWPLSSSTPPFTFFFSSRYYYYCICILLILISEHNNWEELSEDGNGCGCDNGEVGLHTLNIMHSLTTFGQRFPPPFPWVHFPLLYTFTCIFVCWRVCKLGFAIVLVFLVFLWIL